MPHRFRVSLLSVCFMLALGHAFGAQAQTATKYVCPMHADVVSTAPGKCPRCSMTLVAVKSAAKRTARRKSARGNASARSARLASTPSLSPTAPPRNWATLSTAERVRERERLAPTYDYTCLMHPDIHQAQEGVCPKCGMPLVSLHPTVTGAYQLALTATPRSPQIGETVRLRFVIANPQTGARVKRFVLNHEKLFHLFLVSQDMTDYQHIHPQFAPDGSFTIETTLQRAGRYKLHADFFPVDGTPQIIHRELVTAGYGRVPAAPARLTPDATLTKTFAGLTVNLVLGDGSAPQAGAYVPLKYHLTDAQTGAPVTDLEPYLGAWGHTLILNADQSEYLHSHPTEMLPDGEERAGLHGGPDVEFAAMFPAAGDYRIWTQFQRGGKVITASFTIRVQPAPQSAN